ncbi:hypothetical protein GWI33_016085 [Rhynchophorus ferrugineus]|uniref:BAG domain-containing protein n=1 Tax=Rhynchophorus ferrugineus TaxID=354439 RepID=A0A834M5B6_RHYFE|nr:hypothetical protein GWI33_016085 [Rhynchophorus ferrugineus]
MFLRHTINKHIYRTVAPETSRNNAAEVRLTERRLRTLKPKTDTTIKKNGFKRNKNIKTLKNWQKELAEKLDKQNKSLKFHMSEMFGQIEEPQNLRRFNVSTPTVDDLKMNSANGNFTYWDAKWMQIQAGRGDRLEIKPHEADIHSTEIPPFNLVVDKAGQIKTNEQLAQVHNLSEDETKLMKIEQKLEGLKAEITSFAGVRSDNKFYELDETMMRLILLLDKLEINDQILRQRKKYLLKKIYKLSEELDCRAQQKELLKREKNLKTISKSLEVPHQNEEDIEKAKLYVKNIEKQREQITVNNENLMVDNDFHEGLQILEKEMKNQMLKYMHPLKECRRSSATIDHCIQQTRKLLIIEKKLKRVIDWLQIPQKISDDIERVNDFEDKLEALKPEIFSFVGVRSDKKFNELDGTVLGLILLLDRLEINDECLRKRKKCLLKNIHKLGKELDLRAQQEKFLNGEKNLKTISNWLETPRKNEEDIDKAKSYIKSPQKLLEPIKVFISV